jgi:hypothetical protein
MDEMRSASSGIVSISSSIRFADTFAVVSEITKPPDQWPEPMRAGLTPSVGGELIGCEARLR